MSPVAFRGIFGQILVEYAVTALKMSSDSDNRLARLLLAEGRITQADLERAFMHPDHRIHGLAYVLDALGVVSEGEILAAVARATGVEAVHLDDVEIPLSLAELVSDELCIRHLIMPVAGTERELMLAMLDPGDLRVIDDIRFRLGVNVRPVAASERALREALERVFPARWAGHGEPADPVVRELRSRNLSRPGDDGPEAEARARDRFRRISGMLERGGAILEEYQGQLVAEDLAVVRLWHEVLQQAVAEQASHVRLMLSPERVEVVFCSQGAWGEALPLPSDLWVRIIWYAKTQCNLPIGPVVSPLQSATGLRLDEDRSRWFRVFLVPVRAGLVVLLAAVPETLAIAEEYSLDDFAIARPRWWQAYQAGRDALQSGRASAAEAQLCVAVAEAEAAGAEGRRPLADTLVLLARAVEEQGRTVDARSFYQQALELQRADYGPDSPLAADTLTGIADTFYNEARFDEAIASYREAVSALEMAYGDADLEVAWMLDRLQHACEAAGQTEEAALCREESDRVLQRLLDLPPDEHV